MGGSIVPVKWGSRGSLFSRAELCLRPCVLPADRQKGNARVVTLRQVLGCPAATKRSPGRLCALPESQERVIR